MRRAEYLKWNKLERLCKKTQSWNLLFSLDNPASEPLALISCPASRAGQTTLNTTFHPVRAMMEAFVFIAVLAWAAKSWPENNHGWRVCMWTRICHRTSHISPKLLKTKNDQNDKKDRRHCDAFAATV
jgi:hypothetical protein